MRIELPKDHPRYESLLLRERLTDGHEQSVVATAGLIAHGRGEAFDYLVGEESCAFAREATVAAACAFLLAARPVVSVNGNVAALCPADLVELSRVTGAPLEVNLFYRTAERELAIERVLKKAGATEVLGVGPAAAASIPELGSERRRVDPRGIASADLVFVPLEDGDRTEALTKMAKTVVTVDLNPLSRTAREASITIVDNISRALPALIEEVSKRKIRPKAENEEVLRGYDNRRVLSEALLHLSRRLETLARTSEL